MRSTKSLSAVLCSMVLAHAGSALAALPPVPVPPENPITEAKRVLGKVLFWDEQLSSTNTMSCGSCHSPNTGGTDPRNPARNAGDDLILNTGDDILGSPGVIHSDSNNNMVRDSVFGLNPQITGRSSMSMINAAYANDTFWDGRGRTFFIDPETSNLVIPNGGGLESQAVGPPMNSTEMAHEGMNWSELSLKLARSKPWALATNWPADIQTALASNPSYPDLFRAAFGSDVINARRIAFAIATYQRTLISDQTPFDRFRQGVPGAMTQAQIQGFNFMAAPPGPGGGGGCGACHNVNNDLFTDQTFRNIGLRPPSEDTGRQVVTGNANDRGKFKVPSLRNVGLRRTFMHNGQFTTLGDVIRFYARAPGAAPQFPENQDPAMAGVNVPPQIAPAVIDFLTNALTDPRVRDQTFPFDRPTLFSQRTTQQTVSLGGGVAGSGNITPRVVVLAPSLIGDANYRVGLDGAAVSKNAKLGISLTAPVSGRITPTRYIDAGMTTGSGNGQGIATAKWPLPAGSYANGQVVYAQWFVDDSSSIGGQALSNVVQITMFCPTGGCLPVCVADLAGAGGTIGADGQLTVDDLIAFLSAFFASNPVADLAGLGGSRGADGLFTPDDLLMFLGTFFSGCN